MFLVNDDYCLDLCKRFYKHTKVINKGSITDISETLIEYLLIQCNKQ